MMGNFLPGIVNFNTDGITDDIGRILARDYLSNPEYEGRDPKACTSLLWSASKYILKEVERAKEEAEDAEKGEAEDDEDLEDID